MSTTAGPTIAAVVAAYQAERWIGPAVESILGQTRPPDEVVVVDDGSTDGTAAVLAGFGPRIRLLRQENRGYPAAMNAAIAAARSDFVALCGADDLWEPDKLAWQEEVLRAQPHVGVLSGHAVFFGRVTGDHARPPADGVQDPVALADALMRRCVINAPSVVVRRELFARLGGFREDFAADDYDFWFRCLRAGVVFAHDPRTVVRYRQHDANITADHVRMLRDMNVVRAANIDLAGDRGLVHLLVATDRFRVGRLLVDAGRPAEARRAFLGSLRHVTRAGAGTGARALAWALVVSLPAPARAAAARAGVGLSRAAERRWGVRPPVTVA